MIIRKKTSNTICSVKVAPWLDGRIRKFMHNPEAILAPYLRQGMKVVDIGCGPRYFTLPLAKLVGERGQVYAVDLQQGMLDIIEEKIQNSVLKNRIVLHRSDTEKIGLEEHDFDFVLSFWMLHEVPNPQKMLAEIKSLLRPGGHLLLIEPRLHVSIKDFTEETNLAKNLGFKEYLTPHPFASRAVLLKNEIF